MNLRPLGEAPRGIAHFTAEWVGIHAARWGTLLELLEPLRRGVRDQFGAYGQAAAGGLARHHDHSSQLLSDLFQTELRSLGINSSLAFVREPEGNGGAEHLIRTVKERLLWLERFATWGRDEVEVTCFRAPLECTGRDLPAALQSVIRMRLAGGKPVESERYMPPTGSCSRERYRHEGGRLARVEEDSCDEGGGLATIVKEVVYGEDGRVTGVDAVGPDGRRVVWRSGGQPHPARREVRPSVPARLRRQVCA